jgi:hypothetical protein
MPLLAAFLGSLFGAIAQFFTRFVAARTAMGLAAVSVFGVLTVAFVGAISTAITAVLWAGVLPAPVVLGFSFFMPDNFALCVSTIIALEIASALYRWNVKNNSLLLGF